MNKGNKIFSIGQVIMVIGAIAYIIDLLFIESAKYSSIITARLGADMAQKLPSVIVNVLAIVFGVAIVLMLIGWIIKRGEKSAE